MAYFYVKAGGTATNGAGRYETARTGSWATAFSGTSEYYDTVYILGSTYSSYVQAGDVIFVSDLHNKTGAASGVRSSSYPLGCKIISVDDDDVTVLSPGGKEAISSYWLICSMAGCYVYGVDLNTNDDLFLVKTGFAPPTIFENCLISAYLTIGTGNDSSNAYGTYIFRNCTISRIVYVAGGYGIFLNCSFPNNVTKFYFGNTSSESWDRGGHIYVTACDFYNTTNPIYNSFSYVYGDRSFKIATACVERSSIAASTPQVAYISGSRSTENPFTVHNCGTTGEKYFTEVHKYALVEGNTVVYRNGGAKIEDVTPYSLKVIISDKIYWDSVDYKSKHLRLKIAEFIADFTDLIECRIEILQPNSSVTFKKDDLWAEMLYPDSSSSKANFVSTKGNLVTNNDAYSMSSETWTGLIGPVAQYVSIVTTQTGREGLCTIWLNCNSITPINRTFYICPKIKMLKVA